MELKVCTASELKGLEGILFEQNLTLGTYTRLMDKVKANYMEHIQFEEKIKKETPPFCWVGDRVNNPSKKDYLDDINGHFRISLLGMGGCYISKVEEGKSVMLYRHNFTVSMPEVVALRGKDKSKTRRIIKTLFGRKDRYYTDSEIEKIKSAQEWKGLSDEILGQKGIGWGSSKHCEGRYFFYEDDGRVHLARRIYQISAIGEELSVDQS